jgi:cyclopropane fatty-acyl-phospholipid synthase-like methyltransferase
MAGRDDAKRLVAEGYDQIAGRYDEWKKETSGSPRMRYLDELLKLLPQRPTILELGSGAGVETTRVLASRGRLTGVDISRAQIELAKQRVPDTTFVQGDMTEIAFGPESFDAVVSFYALTHVPRVDLPGLVERIFSWLRADGLFLATFGAGESAEGVDSDWLGVPMFFSGLTPEENRQLVRRAGFRIIRDEVVTQDEGAEGPASFLWILARKPRLEGS